MTRPQDSCKRAPSDDVRAYDGVCLPTTAELQRGGVREMNNIWGATVAVVIAVTLSGCGGNTSDSTQSETKPSTKISRTVHEKVFLSVLHPELGAHSSDSDTKLIQLGQDICSTYSDGASWLEVLATLKKQLDGVYSAGQIGQIMGASTAAFCPEFNDKAPS